VERSAVTRTRSICSKFFRQLLILIYEPDCCCFCFSWPSSSWKEPSTSCIIATVSI
jgi:hypothetical protein